MKFRFRSPVRRAEFLLNGKGFNEDKVIGKFLKLRKKTDCKRKQSQLTTLA